MTARAGPNRGLSKPGRLRGAMAAAAWVLGLCQPPPGAAAERFAQSAGPVRSVALELVLAVDISISVNGFEYALITGGMAHAFRDPEVVALITGQGGVAVTLFQWNSRIAADRTIPWTLLDDPASIGAFADRVQMLRRSPGRGFTAIGTAIDHGVRLIGENGFDGRRRTIDVSGDGYSNTGIPLIISHQRAREHGIVVNGLPILSNHSDLDTYYFERVILGSGAFVEPAASYDDFAAAFLRKLRRELAIAVSNTRDPPEAGRPCRLTRYATRARHAVGPDHSDGANLSQGRARVRATCSGFGRPALRRN